MIFTDFGMIGPNEVVLSPKSISGLADSELVAIVREYSEIAEHPFNIDSHQAGQRFDSIEQFWSAYEGSLIVKATKDRKQALTKIRRAAFNQQHAALELALIDRDGYVCQHPGCNVTEALTIDHIIPISRGGTDDLANMRLMCRPHNSSKGDKIT